MNAAVKQQWVDALRSGEYFQEVGKYRSTDGCAHCVLGVLIDLHSKATGQPWHPALIDDTRVTAVFNWAGLRVARASELVRKNDSMEYSFEDLAYEIERSL